MVSAHLCLSDIAILSVHSQRANALDLDLVFDNFANKYPNCRIMLCLSIRLSVTCVFLCIC